MNVTSRSYLTAGIAALGVGAIALSPIQPIPAHTAAAPQRVVSNLAVDLAATINPIQPWLDAFSTAADNAYALQDAFNANPFPIAQTFVQNQFTYLKELPKIGLIFQQIVGNWGNALKSPFVADPDNNSKTLAAVGTLNGDPFLPVSPFSLYQILGSDISPLPPEVAPLLEFMTTPFSGAALAVIGPVLGPVISMISSVKATFAALKARDLPGAINEFLALAPNAVNAFLNGGQILDLTKLVDRFAPLPDSVKSIGLNMGGIVSSGLSPVDGSPEQGVTGTMFDGLATEATVEVLGLEADLKDPGLSVGPVGSTFLLTSKIAEAIKVTPPPATAAALPAAAETAAPEAEAAAPVADVPAVADAEVAEDAPAPKRKSRAATRADNDGGKGNSARANRGARRAG
jgi:hypothetical protein